MIKGRVGRGTRAFPLEWLHAIQRALWPFLRAQTLDKVGQQLQHALAYFLPLEIGVAHGLLSIGPRLVWPLGLRPQPLEAIQTGPIGHDRRHHRLRRGHTLCHMSPRLFPPPILGPRS
jgi:hypothetical protein